MFWVVFEVTVGSSNFPRRFHPKVLKGLSGFNVNTIKRSARVLSPWLDKVLQKNWKPASDDAFKAFLQVCHALPGKEIRSQDQAD